MQVASQAPISLSAGHTSKLAQGAFITLLGKVVATPLRFLALIILARVLGPDTFGLYSIGWTILGIVEAIVPLGLDKGVMRFSTPHLAQPRSGLRGVLLQSIGLAAFSGLLCGAVFVVGAPWLAVQAYGKPALVTVIQLFALAFPAAAVGVVAVAATRISQRMEFSVYVTDLCLPVLNLALFLAALALGWGLVGVVAAGVLAFTAAAGLALYYVVRLFPEVRAAGAPWVWQVRPLLAFSVPASLSGIAVFLIYRVDRLLLGYFRPESEAGVYQAVILFSVFFEFIVAAFASILMPMIVDLERQPGPSQLEGLYRLSTKWGLYLAAPVVMVLCCAPREIMNLVFGAPYEGGAVALVVLALGQLLNVAGLAVGPLQVMTGHQNRWLAITAVILGLDALLCLWLVPACGLLGAAVSTTLALSAVFAAGTLDVKRGLGLWPYDRRYRKGLIAAVLTGLCLAGLSRWSLAPGLKVALAGVTAVGVFVGTLAVLKFDAEDLEFFRLIGARLPWLRR